MDSMTVEEPSQGFPFSGLQVKRIFQIAEVRDGRDFKGSLESSHALLADGEKVKPSASSLQQGYETPLFYGPCLPVHPQMRSSTCHSLKGVGGGEDFLTP